MSETRDPYDDQLRAARYRAERDQAREECDRLAKKVGHLKYLLDGEHRKAERRKKHIEICEAANGRLRRSMGKGMTNADVEAAKWVREHGGLRDVKSVHDNGELPLCDLCEILGLDRVNTSWMDAFRELEKRLMPEGMEWPRFEDGEPVRIGDYFEDFFGDDIKVCHMDIDNKGSSINFGGPNSKRIASGERVKRAAPKVTDADGAEIRKGDTVWHVETGERCKVVEANSRSVSVDFRVDGDGTKHTGSILPVNLTHRAPVLAADGKPLREGETVWYRDHIDPLEVRGISTTESGAQYVKAYNDYEGEVSAPAEDFTHERPVADSWERLEEDARGISHDISWNLGNWSPSDYKEADDNVLARIESLIPRAKALAERGR